jgi:hypothetical protein
MALRLLSAGVRVALPPCGERTGSLSKGLCVIKPTGNKKVPAARSPHPTSIGSAISASAAFAHEHASSASCPLMNSLALLRNRHNGHSTFADMVRSFPS